MIREPPGRGSLQQCKGSLMRKTTATLPFTIILLKAHADAFAQAGAGESHPR